MEINFFTKDSTVFPPVILDLPEKSPAPGPSDARIGVVDRPNLAPALPDSHGNFLYGPNQPQFDACQTYGVLKLGMNLYSNVLSRNLPFAFKGKVHLYPHDGEGINAYYSRQDHGVHFLDMTSPKFKRDLGSDTLIMAQSLDVDAHEEVGHLLLDGLKPHYMNFELESQAFHEAFGDISAMILALQFDQVVDKLLEETQGDLTRSNVVSRLGKKAGIAMQDLSAHPNPRHYFLRDAAMTMQYDWKYEKPERLSQWNPSDEKALGQEPHNFSRFFSGVWYEIFAALYEQEWGSGASSKDAVKTARDVATDLVLRSVADFSPDTSGQLESIAKGMLHADQADFNGAHQALLLKIFKGRNLFNESEAAEETLPDIRLTHPIHSAADAKKFLAKHRKFFGLPEKHSFQPAEDFPKGRPRYVYHNDKGETFLVYHMKQTGALSGPHYRELQGAEYEAMGSIKLGFDKNGRLIYQSQSLIDETKHAALRGNIRRHHENGLIKIFQPGMQMDGKASWFKQDGLRKIPYAGYAVWNDGKMMLRRVPILT